MQFKRWINEGLPPIQIAVNISGTHFLQDNFISRIEQIIKETEMNPHYLELEITENVFLGTDQNQIINTFEQLHRLGIKLSLDDFGTGYSALNYLHQFPIDYLKIDQSFIRQMTSSESMVKIVDTITKLARCLGLKVIAEGVEHSKEIDILLNQECDQVQGYFYSKPLSADDFTAFYKKFTDKIKSAEYYII